jgi:cytochrome c oxidase assembly factor CtaG
MLFWVHMVQHELLILIAAPLLVMGSPLVVMLWALSPEWRVRAGIWAKQRSVSLVWAGLTAPFVVWLLHGIALWIWHVPALYQASVNDEFTHALQHSTFFGTALLFWWTLIHGKHGRLTYGASLLYVFTTMVHSGVLGAFLTLTPSLWYPVYAGRAERFGISALQDQQLGGLIMWVPSGVVFMVVILALFAAWMGESERRAGYSRLAALVESSPQSK